MARSPSEPPQLALADRVTPTRALEGTGPFVAIGLNSGTPTRGTVRVRTRGLYGRGRGCSFLRFFRGGIRSSAADSTRRLRRISAGGALRLKRGRGWRIRPLISSVVPGRFALTGAARSQAAPVQVAT